MLVTGATSGNTGSAAQSTAYVWGPAGHPVLMGSSIAERVTSIAGTVTTSNPIAYETLHWDGTTLLFTSNPQGQLDDIKVGTLGDITPLDAQYKGLTFWDRDPSGSVTFCHNATGAGGSGPTSQVQSRYGTFTKVPCFSSSWGTHPLSIAWNGGANPPKNLTPGYGGGVGQGLLVGMPRTDGITDMYTTIQGVRSYDPQLGSWTTPDAYAGNVHDPMSQQSYMYNGNNPLSYTDPSGYRMDSGLISTFSPDGSGFLKSVPDPQDDSTQSCGAKLGGSCLQTGDRVHVDDPKNGTYATQDDAAKAATSHYSTIEPGGSEIGAETYCYGYGKCGYGDAIVGEQQESDADVSYVGHGVAPVS